MNNQDKDRLRHDVLRLRDALNRDEVVEWSRQIQMKMLESFLINEVGTVALYSPHRNEVETGLLFTKFKERGKRVCFPVAGDRGVEFYVVDRLEALIPGKWSILEPARMIHNRLEVEEIDLFVVPGVAFDKKGYRLGFGKGLYDRSLIEVRGVKVGCAYDFQVKEEIPHERGDLRCEWIFTEQQVISTHES